MNKLVGGAILLGLAAWAFYPTTPSKPTTQTKSDYFKPDAKAPSPPPVVSKVSNMKPDGTPQLGFHDGPPIGEPAITKKISVLPGTVLCQTIDEASGFATLYQSAWEEREKARRNPDQYALMTGKPPEFPVAAKYGCVMVKPGTQAHVTYVGRIPVVTVMAPGDVMYFTGVTFPASFYLDKR